MVPETPAEVVPAPALRAKPVETALPMRENPDIFPEYVHTLPVEPVPEEIPLGDPAKGEVIPARPATSVEGTVAIRTVSASGPVEKVVSRFDGQILGCYEKRAAEKPDLSGTLDLAVSIASGRTTSARASGDPALAACIEGKIKRWTWPPDVAEDATFTLSFSRLPD